MKKIIIIIAVVLAALIVLGVAKDIMLKGLFEKVVVMSTGLRLHMNYFKASIIKTSVDIRGLKIFNPVGFKDTLMGDFPRIYVDYNLISILRGKIYLSQLTIELNEFTVVKNEKGELNLNSIKVVKSSKAAGRKPAAGAGKPVSIQVDKLRLKIGRVIYKDYSKPGEPVIKKYDMNIDEEYTNIKDAYSLVSIIIVRSLMNTNIPSLANFNLGALQGTVSDSIAKAQSLAANTVNGAAQKTSEVLNKTTGTLKNIFEKI